MSVPTAFQELLTMKFLHACHFRLFSTSCFFGFSFRIHRFRMIKFHSFFCLKSHGLNLLMISHQSAFLYYYFQIWHHHMSSNQIFESDQLNYYYKSSNSKTNLCLFKIIKVYLQQIPWDPQFRILQRNHLSFSCFLNLTCWILKQ